MSEEIKDFKYIIPEGKETELTQNNKPDKNGITWDPEFTSYHVEEYCEYYNYDGIFSADMSYEKIFKNKVCLYRDINSAMEKSEENIIAYAYSDFITDNFENHVAFCADDNVDGTPIKKDDRVFVNLNPMSDQSSGIFILKSDNGYSLKYTDCPVDECIYGIVCDIKEKYGYSRYNGKIKIIK